jgi:acetylornithine/N-succinyldiaminopimelate aminotransferase
VLDVVLAPGFLENVRRNSILLRQRLAEIQDRYPGVIAEVRGEGLLLGLRAVVPNGELVDALRAEKLLTIAAGENVVRLLPPQIVGEAEIAEALTRIDRACVALSSAQTKPATTGAVA